MTATPITVTAEDVVYHNYRLRQSSLRTEYKCVGPDGRVFKNTNKSTLTSLLRQRYGKVALTFVPVTK